MNRFTFFLILFLLSLFLEYSFSQINLGKSIDSLIRVTSLRFFNGVILISKNGSSIYGQSHGYNDFTKKTTLKIDDQFLIGRHCFSSWKSLNFSFPGIENWMALGSLLMIIAMLPLTKIILIKPFTIINNKKYYMLTVIIPKLPMRSKAATRKFYLTQLGFTDIGASELEGYLLVKKENVEIHFFEFKVPMISL